MGLIEYVNIKQGTRSLPRFSHGNTYPLTTRPFGMVSFAVQTRGDNESWFYSPDDHWAEGIRVTQIATPWLSDYGYFNILPQEGEPFISERKRASGFIPEKTILKPDRIDIEFLRYRARMMLLPVERGAFITVKYEKNTTPRFTIIPPNYESGFFCDSEARCLTGFVKTTTVGTPKNFAVYFALQFDADFNMEKTCLVRRDNTAEYTSEYVGEQAGYSIAFTEGTKAVNIRLAISFISIEQAKLNLSDELLPYTPGEIAKQAKEEWEDKLSKILIETADIQQKSTFYSCMYRMFLFPRKFYEKDINGEMIHYSCADGQIHKGLMYSDNGFWDTFRTVYPFFAIVIPEMLSEMMESFVNYYKESGWLPKWLCPGEWGLMPGTLIDAVIADTAIKGILKGELLRTAFEGMLKHAEHVSDSKRSGRYGAAEYNEIGYVPADLHKESVNHTLDYAYGDFCIAQVAKILGEQEISERYYKRAENYKKLFDATTGFMRGKLKDGTFKPGFDPFDWGADYCEGGAWQNSFSVFHDMRGLAQLYGSEELLKNKLLEMFETQPFYNVGGYGMEIHEMTEMASAEFGQCAISNQPCFHIPYVFTVLGCPDITAEKVRQLITAFDASENGFPGDEDNGTMAGWYILSTLGFYPVTPGTDQLVRGVMLVDGAEIRCGEKILKLRKVGTGKYVSKITINGNLYSSLYFHHKTLCDNSEIIFYMKDEKDNTIYEQKDLPFSMNDSNL